ncbi:MAG: transporter substrate-binding domain-containing protein, partial [Patescibacteria group bacterium]
MTNKIVIITVVVAIIVSFIGVKLFSKNGSTSGTDSTLATVLNRKEIRVGYVIYPPGMIKDANTGELSGIFHDALEEAGKNLGLKINWVEEVGWGTMIEGLKAGRYDMIGSPVWPSAPRATQADFTRPLTYSVISVYSRANDNRFNNSWDAINSPDVRISVVDGELAQTIAQSQFPTAKVVSLPQLSDISQSLLNVSSGKADVAFVEPYIADAFLKNNPGSIKNVQPNNPLRVNGNSIVIGQGKEAAKIYLKEHPELGAKIV